MRGGGVGETVGKTRGIKIRGSTIPTIPIEGGRDERDEKER